MRHLKPIIFTFPIGKAEDNKVKIGEAQAAGWIVPHTDDTLAIDMKLEAQLLDNPSEAVWCITHLPTGFAVNYGHYTAATCSFTAIEKAQRFYREMNFLGADMKSADPKEIVDKVRALDADANKAFWYRVAGWELKETKISEERK